jgi:alpha-methylacyl-CoA racemase
MRVGGPLAGVRVVEFAGIGPGPLAGMLLADLGADVVRVDRPSAPPDAASNMHVLRGRRTVLADLKDPDGLERVRTLLDRADVLVEGFRPGVMERLGLSPEACLERNPGLVFARITGWGQHGPLATRAGHDINYISLTGALHAIGPREHPFPPLNLVGDFGGGTMFVLTGILAALLERRHSGRGQVVDAAMVDGVGVLLQSLLQLRAADLWNDQRGNNLLDGAAPYYGVYECSDGRFVAVGALEPQFYALLLDGLGLSGEDLPAQADTARWPELRRLFASTFAQHPQAHWVEVFDGTDACVTPVLTFEEAPDHPHVAARGSLTRAGGDVVSAAAPRFSRSPAEAAPSQEGVVDLTEALASWQ